MKSKLIECKACGQQIAKSAKTCPHCGAKNKHISPFIWVILVLMIVLLVTPTEAKQSESIAASNTAETLILPTAPEGAEQTSMETIGALIETMVSQNYENYDVSYDETGITINVWLDGIAEGASMAKLGNQEMLNNWNILISQQVEVCEATMAMLSEFGREDVLVSWNVMNDQNTDNVIVAIMNGTLIYDVVNNG